MFQCRPQERAGAPDGVAARAVLKTLERASFVECWLTVAARPELAPEPAAQALFAETAELLAVHAIAPVQEKIYGRLEARDVAVAAREAAWLRAGLDPETPASFLEGAPAGGGSLAGLQIWGMIPRAGRPVRITTIHRKGCPTARAVTGPGYRMLYLPSVTGVGADGRLPACVTEQAEGMFGNAEHALSVHGMTVHDVVRTWIYLARILHWYGEFNRVRTAFFQERRVGDERLGRVFPASTGIQGRRGREECCMDVLAVCADPGAEVAVHPLLRSSRQDRPFQYGSTFSRGMALDIEGRTTAFVSGTASIGPDGRTRYADSPEAQIMETLLSISALLEPLGGGLADITSATLFCKDPSVLSSFRQVTGLLGASAFPTVDVVADVCRPDLLVEIEAVAAIPLARAATKPS